MSLVSASVSRPVFTSMVTLIVVLLGAFSLTRLQTDLLPEVELPTLTVRTSYEGASPEVMERLVTQILEEIVATVPGVEEIESTSSEGNSRIRIRFGWGTDIDVAAAEVSSTIENELDELPDDVTRPRTSKFDISSFPVVILGISSKLDPVELTTLIDEQVRDRFARLDGVAQVDTWGGYNREIRVELFPDRVRALGIPLNEVLATLRDANLDLPAGQIESGRYEVTLRAPAEFESVEQIRETELLTRDGRTVSLGQIADVRDTYERITRSVRVNGELGLRVAVRKQAGANTVDVSSAILDEIERVNRDFPQIEVLPVINQGNFIERSIKNVSNSVLYGGGLAVLVLLFFLRSLRSTIVISLAIPISVIATFALVYFAGFTLNLMTLGGLALGVGMMVDNSIVVLENIFRRRREESLGAEEAAVGGAGQVAGAIIASTITTLVIFVPIVFVRGVSGVLFGELAYVIAFSLVCSLVVSLSVVPMLAAKLYTRRTPGEQRGPLKGIGKLATKAFDALDDSYRDLLNGVLKRRILTLIAVFPVIASAVFLFPFIGSEFMPPSDEGEVRVSGEMEVGARLDLVDAQTRLMEELVTSATPEIEAWVASAGASGWNPSDGATGDLRISLNPASERERSNIEIADDLRARLDGAVPGMTIKTRAPQGQSMIGWIMGGDEGISVEIRGFDLDTLGALATAVATEMERIPGLTDIDTTQDTGSPQQEIRVDRAKAADLGVSPRDVARAIEIAIAGSRAGEYRPEGSAYRIFVQMKDAHRLTIDDVLALTVRSSSGDDVALRNLVEDSSGRGPTIIQRRDQQRILNVTASIEGRDLGSVAAELEAAIETIPRPVGYDIIFAGAVEEQRKSSNELSLALLLALALVYMVLACQYESLRDPLVVMLAAPLAGIGVVLTLFITDTTLNIQSYIGCIMLAGIVVNNAILIVDQSGRLRRIEGMPTREAVAEAGRRRLRPILMTTLTTMLGLLPLALGIGEGADAQAPLARAVIGGLASSMLTTLVVIPVVYSLIHPDREKSGA